MGLIEASEVAWQVGQVNAAQRFAFVGVLSSQRCVPPRLMKRLVATYLVTGEYRAAEKYIKILESTPHYRDWAKAQRPLLDSVVCASTDWIKAKRAVLPVTDNPLDLTLTFPNALAFLIDDHADNRPAFEYGMGYLLVYKDLMTFMPVSYTHLDVYKRQDVKISLERMSEIHDREEEETPERMITGFNGSDRDIEIRNVTFQYEGIHSPKVLERINLKIPRGKITAIVGTSGSGKTTLIKLLLGYYNPVEGDIRVGGNDLRSFSLLWWRDQCGAVMQDGYLFSESIARNIAVDDGEIDKSRLLLAARIRCV